MGKEKLIPPMEKFSIIPGRNKRSGLTDVQHNESPRCRLLVSDLNINDAYETTAVAKALLEERGFKIPE